MNHLYSKSLITWIAIVVASTIILPFVASWWLTDSFFGGRTYYGWVFWPIALAAFFTTRIAVVQEDRTGPRMFYNQPRWQQFYLMALGLSVGTGLASLIVYHGPNGIAWAQQQGAYGTLQGLSQSMGTGKPLAESLATMSAGKTTLVASLPFLMGAVAVLSGVRLAYLWRSTP